MSWNDFSEVQAIKSHYCEWCKTTKIQKGEKHLKFVGMFEGDFQSWRLHKECIDPMEDSTPWGEPFCENIHSKGSTCGECQEYVDAMKAEASTKGRRYG